MRMLPIVLSIAFALLLAGCADGLLGGGVINPQGPDSLAIQPAAQPEPAASTQPAQPEEPQKEPQIEFTEESEQAAPAAEPTTASESSEETFDGLVLTYTEGDLIELTPQAIDPDGDKVSYQFSEPLSHEGKWQTQIGDEGRYLIQVTASDGKAETEEDVLLVIRRANRAPIIQCKDRAVLNEGDRFFVGDYCEITDPDDEEVVVQYGGWPGYSRYVTTYNDAGRHTLFITANDKIHTVKGELEIHVVNVNRKPEFTANFPKKLVGVEGDVLTIDASDITDPDGDTVTFTFSEPFDKNGVWRTKIGDAGTYSVDVVANDGESSVKKTISVEVKQANTKPVLKPIPDIVVDEGETVKIPVSATDREGDTLKITYSGWMTSDSYTTTYDDAGQYTVKVTVSDGVNEVSQIVHITVKDVNRPPVFVTPA